MKTTMLAACAALAMSVAIWGGAMAQMSPAPGTIGVIGLGTESCATYLQQEQQNNVPFAESESWVAGFVTGHNNYTQESHSGTSTDEAGIRAWFNSYCSAHPYDSLMRAADHFIVAFPD